MEVSIKWIERLKKVAELTKENKLTFDYLMGYIDSLYPEQEEEINIEE